MTDKDDPTYLRRLAMRWALVKFTVELQELDAKDRAAACEANGWKMSDASHLYTQVIDVLEGLVQGRVDVEEYLENERLAALTTALRS